MRNKILATEEAGTVLFIRLMVGGIFLSEGLQKLILPGDRGSGLFVRMNFPMPTFSAYLAAFLEIICSLFVLVGLFTRIFTVPLLIITMFSLVAVQLPLLVYHDLWDMLHSARVDWCMLLGCCFLLFKGGGSFSMDRKWWKW